MRQRKVKNLEEKMLNYQKYFIEDAFKYKGKWQSVFENKNDIYLEIGTGKGQFIIEQAKNHLDRNYIGIEGQSSVVFRALQKLGTDEGKNVRFTCLFIDNICDMFEDGEVSGIYLNFSDPWPKKGHAHRRLTYKSRLAEYNKILKKGGTLEFKTDNDALFEFTENEVINEVPDLFEIEEITRDLHGSDILAKNIMTEYEEKFKALGEKIKFIKIYK